MIVCKCIEKFRDKHDVIVGYALVDKNGVRQEIEAKQLKKMIERREIDVVNLTLTSDGRLISTDKTDKFDLAEFRELYSDKAIYRRYQGIFDAIGVDVLGAIYMIIPTANDTADSLMYRTLKYELKYSNRPIPDSINELLAHPDVMIGAFSKTAYTEDSSDVRRTDGKTVVTGVDSITRIPLLLLHKDGKMKLVLCSEMEYAMNVKVSLMEGSFNKDDADIKRNLAIVTLNSNLEAEAFDVGKRIDDREKVKLANRILRSNLAYWTEPEAAKKMMQKVDRKEMSNRLKCAGVTSLAVPFVGVLAVGAVGAAIVATLAPSIMFAAEAERDAMWAGMKARREYEGSPMGAERAAFHAEMEARRNYGSDD